MVGYWNWWFYCFSYSSKTPCLSCSPHLLCACLRAPFLIIKRVPCPYSEILPLSSCPMGWVYTSRPGLTAEFPPYSFPPFHPCSWASPFNAAISFPHFLPSSSHFLPSPSCFQHADAWFPLHSVQFVLNNYWTRSNLRRRCCWMGSWTVSLRAIL